jgi:hypothetical protein
MGWVILTSTIQKGRTDETSKSVLKQQQVRINLNN